MIGHQEWARKNPEKVAVIAAKWQRKNRHKHKAHETVHRALRNGKLQKQPCVVCGSIKSEAHHPDYEKPLEITWVCHFHHCEIHMNVRKEKL